MKNVIFDIGGVLLNWNTVEIVNSFAQTCSDDEKERRNYAALLQRDVFGHADWLATDAGSLSVADAIKRFAKRTGQPVAEMQRLWDHSGELLTIKPDTISLLHELNDRGISLYCLSNMPMERFNYLRERFDFWPLFRGTVISGQVKLMKPDAAIFQHLLEKFDLVAEESIFIDDTLHNAIGAQAVGIRGIHFTDAASCRDQLDKLLT